jgi:hypothetical protein
VAQTAGQMPFTAGGGGGHLAQTTTPHCTQLSGKQEQTVHDATSRQVAMEALAQSHHPLTEEAGPA